MTVKKQNIACAEPIEVNNFLWIECKNKPETNAFLALDDDAFKVRIVVNESNPRREMTENFSKVCTDSCVEWFAQFCPDICDRYFNFELNANGVIDVSFRRDRHDKSPVDPADIPMLGIKAEVNDDKWSVEYRVPFDFIKKYIPQFDIKKCDHIRCNFYKCGDLTAEPHYASWNPVGCTNPDFHRPDYFAEVKVDNSGF